MIPKQLLQVTSTKLHQIFMKHIIQVSHVNTSYSTYLNHSNVPIILFSSILSNVLWTFIPWFHQWRR